MTFDARKAKKLESGEHLKIDDCPGLRLVRTDTGHTWTYRYKSPADERIRQLRLGAWPAMPVQEAIRMWSEARAERDKGVDLAAVRREERRAEQAIAQAIVQATGAEPQVLASGQVTVRVLVNSYVERELRGRRKDRGTNEVQRSFDTMLDAIATRAACDITRADAYGLIESFRHIPVQASNLKSELRAAWAYGLDRGLLPPNTPNWWGEVFRNKLKSKGKKIEGVHIGPVKRCLGEHELGQLIPWLPNFSKQVHDVLVLYIWTMARGSEICAMEAHEITKEDDGMWWTIPKIKTKVGRHPLAQDFRVPLVGRARDIVQRRLEQHPKGFLFPSTGLSKHMQQKAVQTAVHFHQPYSKTRPDDKRPRLTVTHWAPHDLRRTSHTLLKSLDCPFDVAEVMLGHMTGVYNRHKYDPQQRRWAVALDRKLEELAKAALERRAQVPEGAAEKETAHVA